MNGHMIFCSISLETALPYSHGLGKMFSKSLQLAMAMAWYRGGSSTDSNADRSLEYILGLVHM
ncbi:uncharacterized protein N7500_007818 [Penicillium coprophilum]|uniref:uncharacterized protein n=1 Tax=Penicillium coprophilum TaxID=36646 RepID=UPI002384DE38|nr:uncharacterized protein N7500_007818 [Penicillium coprophilum]KAJ5158167.1 hypothetical protein N7500_007818 [Penicillium coprophilum]